MYQKGLEMSHMIILRHLSDNRYKKALSRAIPMLTDVYKQKYIKWAQQHLNDNWSQTLFSDEIVFQLFWNTVKHWYKNKRLIHFILKDRTKIFT